MLAVPLWAFAPTLPLLFAGGFLMQAFVQGAWGVIPAHLSELSPDSVRGFLPGFGYQMGVLFSSAIPRIEADDRPPHQLRHRHVAGQRSSSSCCAAIGRPAAGPRAAHGR